MKEFLKNKGWIGTLLGVFLGFPVGISVTVKYIRNPEFSQMELITTIVLIVLAMIWVMLPSSVEVSTKIGSFKVED